MIDELDDDNFLMYAIKNYHTPNYILAEFENDLKRIKYIKRLIGKYKETKELKERLILNHIIMLNNAFGAEATNKILFFKIEAEDYQILKTFLSYLNILPILPFRVKGEMIYPDKIKTDLHIEKILKNI